MEFKRKVGFIVELDEEIIKHLFHKHVIYTNMRVVGETVKNIALLNYGIMDWDKFECVSSFDEKRDKYSFRIKAYIKDLEKYNWYKERLVEITNSSTYPIFNIKYMENE